MQPLTFLVVALVSFLGSGAALVSFLGSAAGLAALPLASGGTLYEFLICTSEPVSTARLSALINKIKDAKR
jgi:hypothetical protein